jgi:WS/DGAT/MGAT family acyltransferase
MKRGRFGVLAKAHHAIVDGVGGTDMIVSLLDLEPSPAATESPPWKPEAPPSGTEVFLRGCGELALQPQRMVNAARRLAGDAVGTVRRARAAEGNAFTIGSPRTSLNTSIGPRRRVAFANFALDDARRIKSAFGATVNDVVLAVCGGALNEYLAGRGEQVDATLTASVPVSVRTEEDKGTLGNRLAGVIVPLHTDVADPADRLRAIVGETAQAKEIQSAISASIMTDWAEFATPLIAGRAFRFMTRTRITDRFAPIYTLTISNVPGPPFPLYLAGARLESMNPIGPLMDGNALGITVASYMGTIFVGLIADADALSDVDGVTAAIPGQIAALLAAAKVAAKD